jgi:hypothetical protein
MNVCLIDAFGISVDKSKSKNKAARVIFDTLTKVVGQVRSSLGATQWYETLQLSLLGTQLKLKNVSPTRWSSVTEVRDKSQNQDVVGYS